MLSNLKTRFERNLIYVSPWVGSSLGSDQKGSCVLEPQWEAQISPAEPPLCGLWFELWGFYHLTITC